MRRLMTNRILTMTLMSLGIFAASPQNRDGRELARLLANNDTREGALAAIAASGVTQVPLLLSLASNPPAEVDKHDLYVGLAEAFGRIRASVAIPF